MKLDRKILRLYINSINSQEVKNELGRGKGGCASHDTGSYWKGRGAKKGGGNGTKAWKKS
ncbi:hypothetical protein HRbin13_00241 [bacterium HR13]|nr:hypothetical protein HRbin13_00241 [bacterium HR13]